MPVKKEELKTPETIRKVAIVGLSNTGKSQVFNNLTGSFSLVANYHYSTIDIKKALCTINGQTWEVIDTPGLHSLYIHAEEELLVRNMLFHETPDVIVQCMDANQISQSLSLTADLIELGIPLAVSLNAVDETAKKGVWIDSDKLSRLLGVPVVESIAIQGIGTKELKEGIANARKGRIDLRYGDLIESSLVRIEEHLPDNTLYKRKIALLALMGDPFLKDYLKALCSKEARAGIKEEALALQRQFKGTMAHYVDDRVRRWVDGICQESIKKQKVLAGHYSYRLAGMCRNLSTGIPILIGIILILYYMVVDVAGVLSSWMDGTLWQPVKAAIDDHLQAGFWNEFLIGPYGILSLGLANSLITILPILGTFFVVYNILEDVGYIPNLSVMVRRLFEKVGLGGTAIMPIILGFSCKTMATMTTKTLHSRREKFIAVFLISFAIPCAPSMGLSMGIVGKAGFSAFVITFLVLAVVEITAGLLLNFILKPEPRGVFIQELPAMRLPTLASVVKKTYYRLYWFLKETLPVFVYAAAVMFALHRIGVLDILKRVLSPIVHGFLGLPTSMTDPLLMTLARREAAAGMIINVVDKGGVSYVQCIVVVVLTTMFMPCFANVGAMVRELGLKSAMGIFISICVSALAVAGSLNWVLIHLFNL